MFEILCKYKSTNNIVRYVLCRLSDGRTVVWSLTELKQVMQQYPCINGKLSSDGKLICPVREVVLDKETLLVHHGSSGVLSGQISPYRSRSECDFGKGFYTTQEAKSAKVWSIERGGNYYVGLLNLRGLRCYTFTDALEWALYVGVNRGHISVRGYEKLEQMCNRLNSYDVLNGIIADDKMYDTFTAFVEGNITTESLSLALKCIKLGNQIVLKTPSACNKFLILAGDYIQEPTRTNLLSEREIQRKQINRLTEEAVKQGRRKGKYIDECLEAYR